MKARGLLLVGLLWLLLPRTGLALDAETQRLEAEALCQAMPYVCAPPPPDPVYELCDRLTPHMALIASKRLHHEALDAADWDAEQIWKASCLDWEQKRRQRQQQAGPPPSAFVVPRHSITTECWTVGGLSSTTTTCTTYGD